VDRDGGVYRYTGGERLRTPKRDDITEEELEAEYSQGRSLVRTVTAQELAKIVPLIEAASRGSYSDRERRGADQGATVTLCYTYDPTTKRYRQVELEVSGDWSYRNLSPGAQQLTRWLTSIVR